MVPLEVLFKLLPFYLISSVSALPQSSTSCSHTTSSFESTSSPLPTSTSSPPSTNNPFPATIFDDSTDAFINEVLADWKSPGGIAVAFVRQNELGEWTNVEAKGYGVATANGTKVTKDTTFNIGSNSKLFNVLAASFLIGNETLSPRINWDTKIQSIIPEFNLTDPIAARESTLLDLMTHRTGYPLHDFAYRYSDDIPSVIAKLQHQRQSASFRDIWQYNNNMYTTLSYLPSLLSNTTYARYVKENIFDPLNMTATTFSYQLANSHGQRADGMGRQGRDVYADPFGGTPRAVQYWTATTGGEDGSVLAGAGGVITSAVDMATWLQTLLLDGRHPITNETVFPPGTLRKITSAISVQTTRPEFPEVSLIAYGAAQLQITYRGHLIIEHGGFIRGFNSQISRLPYDGLGVAVLTNDNEHGKVQTEIIKNYILDKALGLDPIDWSGRWKVLRSVPPARATPRPSNATAPSVDFPQLAGMYNNDGYGPIELCLVSPTNTGSSASESCEALASNISTILPGGIRQGIPTLVGAVDSPWYSHIRVEHFDADLFNVSLLISTPTDDPKEPFWTYNDKSQSDNLQTAELNVEGSHIGLGLAGFWAGLWDGAEAGVPKPKGDTVRERAEVYFDKITA